VRYGVHDRKVIQERKWVQERNRVQDRKVVQERKGVSVHCYEFFACNILPFSDSS